MHFLRYLWVFETKCESSRSKIIQFGLNNLHERGGGVKKKREDVGGERRWEMLGEKGRVELVGGEKGCEGNSRRGGEGMLAG